MSRTLPNPNYQEDSQEFERQVCLDLRSDLILEAARQEILAELSESIGKIKQILKEPNSFSDPVSERLKLDAAKHFLKLGGLEVDHTKHSGSVTFEPLTFGNAEVKVG